MGGCARSACPSLPRALCVCNVSGGPRALAFACSTHGMPWRHFLNRPQGVCYAGCVCAEEHASMGGCVRSACPSQPCARVRVHCVWGASRAGLCMQHPWACLGAIF